MSWPRRPEIQIRPFAVGAAQARGDVVIIDVCRAFTVAALALHRGAAAILMVGDLDEARALRHRGLGDYCMGERGGAKPPDFDFGNSPSEVDALDLQGKTLIQTTSNGTRGALAALQARRLYAGAFVTAEATVSVLGVDGAADIALVPMGVDERERAPEDDRCAEYLARRLCGEAAATLAMLPARVQDEPEVLRRRKSTGPDQLTDEDLRLCLSLDVVPFAVRIRVESGHLVARAEHPTG